MTISKCFYIPTISHYFFKYRKIFKYVFLSGVCFNLDSQIKNKFRSIWVLGVTEILMMAFRYNNERLNLQRLAFK